MSDQGSHHEDPVESGGLEDESGGGDLAGVGEHRGTAESGGPEEEQQGHGYGAEGEREQPL